LRSPIQDGGMFRSSSAGRASSRCRLDCRPRLGGSGEFPRSTEPTAYRPRLIPSQSKKH
jgi:hypothetical protein